MTNLLFICKKMLGQNFMREEGRDLWVGIKIARCYNSSYSRREAMACRQNQEGKYLTPDL